MSSSGPLDIAVASSCELGLKRFLFGHFPKVPSTLIGGIFPKLNGDS